VRHVCGKPIFKIRHAHFFSLPDLRQENEANICQPNLRKRDLRLPVQQRWRPPQLAAWSSEQVVHYAPRRRKEPDHDLMCMVSRDFWETNFFNDAQCLRLARCRQRCSAANPAAFWGAADAPATWSARLLLTPSCRRRRRDQLDQGGGGGGYRARRWFGIAALH
jgi:hypothetical protein